MLDITEFVAKSIGRWRSQRSAHHLTFGHFEAVESEIEIVSLSTDDPAVIDLCKSHNIDPGLVVSPFRVSWDGQSDWNEDEVLKGSNVLAPVPDPDQARRGKLLRDQGYAETMAAAGDYTITEDGTFVLVTGYDRAAAEEKIWFVNPNVRCRVSLIKTSAVSGVVTASFSSEIRQGVKSEQ
ncbi:MAG: phycobiliprotein lyase [Leptolyngbyaceae cyanobacterium MO_188.B28]|nr:phycobiliprotein lyase [Leptolyngbyaceae cyanobacterium MO_188.B28]